MTDLAKSDQVQYVSIAKGVAVADTTCEEIIEEALRAYHEARQTGIAQIMTALHVGGLNMIKDPGTTGALQRARVVYADGIAVVLLAKLAGARLVRRSATTDIGLPVLRKIAADIGRPLRLCLVGGKPGLADRAAQVLGGSVNSEVVHVTDGYKSEVEWKNALQELRESAPDVIVLGLGFPRELLFADVNRHELPPSLLMTCGGWFGFLTGDEVRAHPVVQRLGLEWLKRLSLNPRRLVNRYSRGAVTTVLMAFGIVRRRFRLDSW